MQGGFLGHGMDLAPQVSVSGAGKEKQTGASRSFELVDAALLLKSKVFACALSENPKEHPGGMSSESNVPPKEPPPMNAASALQSSSLVIANDPCGQVAVLNVFCTKVALAEVVQIGASSGFEPVRGVGVGLK